MFAVSVFTPRLPAAYHTASAASANDAAATSRGRATTTLAHAASHAPMRSAAKLAPRLQRFAAFGERGPRGQRSRQAVERRTRDAIATRQRQQRAPAAHVDDRAQRGRLAPATLLVDPTSRTARQRVV